MIGIVAVPRRQHEQTRTSRRPLGSAVTMAGFFFAVALAAVTAAHAQVMATVAGGGAGDGGLAIRAQLSGPYGIAFDAAGNLYFAESERHRVRKVDALSGAISTVAGSGLAGFSGNGGPATAASLNTPTGVAVASNDDLYIADRGNLRIRRVRADTGVISTFAGNGGAGTSGDGGVATSAAIDYPYGMTLDGSNNLYFAVPSEHRVRRINVATGIITTVAGNGIWTPIGSLGDGGHATAATLYYPTAVAVDEYGDLFIADSSNHRIRKVSAATGFIITVAGDGAHGFGGDGGLATVATLSYPEGVAVDGAGNVYIAEDSGFRIRKIFAASGIIQTIAGTGVQGFSGDGAAATGAMLSSPGGIRVAGNGDVYTADRGNARIRKISINDGKINTVAGGGPGGGDGGTAVAALLDYPSGIAVDVGGNLYVSDEGHHRVRRIEARTGVISTIAGTGAAGFSGDGGAATQAAMTYPAGVAVDSARNVYIADSYNSRIRKVTASTGIITTVAGNDTPGFTGDGGPASDAALNRPRGVAVDASGNLYVADTANRRVRVVYAATGIISTLAGNGGTTVAGDGGAASAASLSSPDAVAVDSNGNVFIADLNRVRRVDAGTGIITTYAGNGSSSYSGNGGLAAYAGIGNPQGLAVDAAGNLYITSAGNRVHRVSAVTGIITWVAGTGTGGFLGDNGPATLARVNGLSGIAISDVGDLYVADSNNHRVRAVTGSWQVFWRNANGTNATWQFTGLEPTQFASGFPPGVPLPWQVKGTGDIDGDGIVDVVWFDPTYGLVATWFMGSPAAVSRAAFPAAVGAGSPWTLALIGDVTGNGRADLVWRHSGTGQVLVWELTHLGMLGNTWNHGSAPLAYELRGIGDFNGDGIDDLLWFDPSNGVVALWLMQANGTHVGAFPGAVGAGSWRPHKVGDFDGDGNADIFWRNEANGMTAVWYLNGGSIAASDFFVSVPLASWAVGNRGDYDIDGREDLLWYAPASGNVVRWLMQGRHTPPTTQNLPGVGVGWQMIQ